jgi:hypothetical protein
MVRWLAVYSDKHGASAAMIAPSVAEDFPFGVDGRRLGLMNYDPTRPLVLVEMPDPDFPPIGDFLPMVIEVSRDAEVEMQFIDL